MPNEPLSILFVCYANICRSPMAEGVFQHLLEEEGLNGKIVCDSAGVSYGSFGESIHPHVIATLASYNIFFDHKPRRIINVDIQEFDHILALDTPVLQSVWGMGKGHAKVEPLLKYSTIPGYRDVPDPIQTNNFELVYQLVRSSCVGFLASLREKNGF